MLHLVVDRSPPVFAQPPGHADDFGVWTGYRIAEDRADWHPLVRGFYDHMMSVAPPELLPSRQHVIPENIPALLSRIWMIDVQPCPLRYRYRLCGTEMVRALGREVTGCWLDEAHPELLAHPQSRERFRFMAETGRPTWRRGPPLWTYDPDHRTIETCVVPLAADGCMVDKMIGLSVLYGIDGKPA